MYRLNYGQFSITKFCYNFDPITLKPTILYATIYLVLLSVSSKITQSEGFELSDKNVGVGFCSKDMIQ